MTELPAPRAIAFDLMDTLVRDPWKAGLRAAFGDRFAAALEARDPDAWPRFECGELTEDDFWATYADHAPDVAACRRVRVAQTTWLPGMRSLVQDVQGAGLVIALASNYPSWFTDLEPLLAAVEFDAVVVSYLAGVRKPDPPFYEAVAGVLDLDPSEVLFIDDREANAEGARAAGMQAITFVDAATARRHLRARGVGV